MIHHCVLFTFRRGADPSAVDALVEALRELPSRISAIRSYEVGTDLGLRDGNASLGVVATFDDEEGWQTYVDHPDHLAVIDRHVPPIVEGRQAVQFRA